MEIIKITPRGYCHGVVNALNLTAKSLQNENLPRPIYIIGEIVHNQKITKAFDKAGAITLTGKNRKEMLDKVQSGTVIFTAHGTDPHIIQDARDRGLTVIDATCSDVYRTHNLIKNKIKNGYHILYVGKKNHPEPEGVLGIDPKNISLIIDKEDIKKIYINHPEFQDKKMCITNQTTMSMWDVKSLMDYSQTLFSHIEIINELCDATTQRQTATFSMAKDADLTLVVGDPKSNNTAKLVEVSEKLSKCPAYRIETVADINIDWLLQPEIKKVAVTSGASTPTQITQEVIKFIEQFEKEDKNTWDNSFKTPLERIIPRVKRK